MKQKYHEFKVSLGYKARQRSQKEGKREKVSKELVGEENSHKISIQIKENRIEPFRQMNNSGRL